MTKSWKQHGLLLLLFLGVWISPCSCSENKFSQGCLQGLLNDGNYTEIVESFKDQIFGLRGGGGEEGSPSSSSRVCNSNDNDDGTADECIVTEIPYPEIRIHNGDWDSSVLLAWLYQILLTEFLGVPATVGLTTEKSFAASFYAETNDLIYSDISYAYDGLRTAKEDIAEENWVYECHNTKDQCVHVLPEVWAPQRPEWEALEMEEVIEEASSNGMVSNPSFFIPKRTAIEYPDLTIFYGLESNKQLTASLFKKPTTWSDYCQLFNCNDTSFVGAAQREPMDEKEGNMYFSEGLYTGYFLETDQNFCSNSTMLDDCHGYFVSPQCDWSSFSEGKYTTASFFVWMCVQKT